MTNTVPAQPNSNIVAQLAHVGWGFLLTSVALHFMTLSLAVTAGATIAFGKEAMEALGWAGKLGPLSWEGKQTWPSSMEDFAFFMVGIAGEVANVLTPFMARRIHL